MLASRPAGARARRLVAPLVCALTAVLVALPRSAHAAPGGGIFGSRDGIQKALWVFVGGILLFSARSLAALVQSWS